jgi:2-methylisocitrate lyase-like PEP mutase family enzyme
MALGVGQTNPYPISKTVSEQKGNPFSSMPPGTGMAERTRIASESSFGILLNHGWDEALTRAKEFKRIGVDAVFVEALPDRESMRRCVQDVGIPTFANIIEGGKTENISAKNLAELGFCAVAYPWTLVAARLKSIRETLDALKKSMTEGAPPMILSYAEVCEGVGFNKYWVCTVFLSSDL